MDTNKAVSDLCQEVEAIANQIAKIDTLPTTLTAIEGGISDLGAKVDDLRNIMTTTPVSIPRRSSVTELTLTTPLRHKPGQRPQLLMYSVSHICI